MQECCTGSVVCSPCSTSGGSWSQFFFVCHVKNHCWAQVSQSRSFIIKFPVSVSPSVATENHLCWFIISLEVTKWWHCNCSISSAFISADSKKRNLLHELFSFQQQLQYSSAEERSDYFAFLFISQFLEYWLGFLASFKEMFVCVL